MHVKIKCTVTGVNIVTVHKEKDLINSRGVVKWLDAVASKAADLGHEGSTPSTPTIFERKIGINIFQKLTFKK